MLINTASVFESCLNQPPPDMKYSVKKPTWMFWRTSLTIDQVRSGVDAGRIGIDWLVCPLGEASRAVEVARLLREPDLFGPALPVKSASSPISDHEHGIPDSNAVSLLSGFLGQIRSKTGYPFLRSVNQVVFWLHCVLVSLAVLLCLLGLGWSASLGFWSFLFLVALTVEAVIVVMVIRAGAEMAIDVADCIAEQTRLAVEAQEKPRPEATLSPPPTPPSGS
jgi:hypothetical protein